MDMSPTGVGYKFRSPTARKLIDKDSHLSVTTNADNTSIFNCRVNNQPATLCGKPDNETTKALTKSNIDTPPTEMEDTALEKMPRPAWPEHPHNIPIPRPAAPR